MQRDLRIQLGPTLQRLLIMERVRVVLIHRTNRIPVVEVPLLQVDQDPIVQVVQVVQVVVIAQGQDNKF